MNSPVDVLIVGAGASGAAVAWSLADTRMHILCLEQGGWMNPATYPSTGRDWEARAFGDYSPSPNIRARPEDYPINDDNSPIKVVNFNGVGGGTVMYTAHFPRLHPSDSRVRSLDGVAEDWPIDYDTLVPFFEENDQMMGVSGRRSRRSAAKPADATASTRSVWRNAGEGDESAWLALVAIRYHGRHRGLRGTRALHQSGPLHTGLYARGEGEHRHHLLALAFLGFTFICSKSRRGSFQLQRKTRRDRMQAKLQEIKAELRRRMHQTIPDQGHWLKQVVTGHFAYYAVPTNSRSFSAFRHYVTDLWRRTLRRRGQKDGFTWDRITKLADDWLPAPRILHPWPEQRFAVKHPR